MKKLIETVMTYNCYPDQSPPWEGWEYIPKTENELEAMGKATGYRTYNDIDDGCLQYCPLTNRYVVAVDGFVEDVPKKEFNRILKVLAEELKCTP